MENYQYLIFVLFLIFTSCEDSEIPIETKEPEIIECTSDVLGRELLYRDENGNQFLWAGEDANTHFNVNNFTLDTCKLKYGLGREHFPALITPEFDNLSAVADDFDDVHKTIVLRTNTDVKVYPFPVLVKHELVNDVVDGKPVMIVYCFLANLAAVYSRTYCDKDLTFGVSGYTYCDLNIYDGLESFVLWDRDTESLWWPINEKGAAGIFRGVDMIRHDETKWEEMRWGEVKANYPNALVLQDNQTLETPENWPAISPEEMECF